MVTRAALVVPCTVTVLALSQPGCGDDALPSGTQAGTSAGPTSAAGTDTHGSETSTQTGPTSGTATDTGTTTGTAPSTGTSGPTGECGNGALEAGEVCDDGEQNGEYGACNSLCDGAVGCGDGLVNGPEECDIQNQAYCDADTCLFIPCDEQEGRDEPPPPFEFSYIWISNTGEGTVSKIDTQTLVEVGRYRTGPGDDDPSRTAVNVNGRYAAVANRAGASVTVFAASNDDCVDADNDGMIVTSSGPDDVKPWGSDECVLWHLSGLEGVTIPSYGPRPLGWDFRDQDPVTCEWETHNLWMGWYPFQEEGRFYYVGGTDGSILQEVSVTPWGNNNSFGPYGGAVDKDHNFWVGGWQGPLLRIDGEDYSHQLWELPELVDIYSYGMALDRAGNPWLAGCSGDVATFDAETETLEIIGDSGGCLRGLMVAADDRAWIAGNGPCRVVEVDTVAKTITNANIPIPGCFTPVGISIDAQGYVWVVDQKGTAYRMDPDTHEFESVDGLVNPYTYSDMTGAGVALQAIPQ